MFHFMFVHYTFSSVWGGERTGLVVRVSTPNWETRVRSLAGSVCCFFEQEIFTPQKYW